LGGLFFSSPVICVDFCIWRMAAVGALMILDDLTKQLIYDAQQGNHDAFEQLYNKFYREVYSVARYILKNDNKAEDVLQETFIKVFYKLPELNNVESFSSWLYIITQNECHMVMRKKDEKLLYMDIEDVEYSKLVDTDPVFPAFHIEAEEDRLFIRQEVEKLPIHHRTAVVYYYYLNLSVKEIAKLLSCNENTIKSRLFAGRSILKKSIAKFQEDQGSTIAFSVLPLAQIIGKRVLEQSIPENAVKAVFLSVIRSVGLSIGPAGILFRLIDGLIKTCKKAARTSVFPVILVVLISISSIAAAAAVLSGSLSFNRKNIAFPANQITETASIESKSNSDKTQSAGIPTALTPESEPAAVPEDDTAITSDDSTRTSSPDNQVSDTVHKILPATKAPASPADDALCSGATQEQATETTPEHTSPNPAVTVLPSPVPLPTVTDTTTAGESSAAVTPVPFLSASADLLPSSDSGTKLAGILVKEDTSIAHQNGSDESNQILLIVTIDSSNITSADFLPAVDHAIVTAATATNDGSAGGVKTEDYVAVQTNTFDFSSCKFLWIKVVSEDLASTQYYSLLVKP